MDDTAGPPRMTRLAFHGPLSEDRAARMIRRLADQTDATAVLDIGCGWGEFMLRLLEAMPAAAGIGIDLNEEDLVRGRANAEARGLTERVRFIQESAVDTSHGPADIVLCLSAGQALSDAKPPESITAALRALRHLVNPSGRVLLGETIWQRPPSPDQLSALWPGASSSDLPRLPDLVDLALDAGFRPFWIETASEDEWEEFESASKSDVEEWLATHPGHPLANKTRDRVDRLRNMWLRGHRGVMGLAYLTLLPVS